jgi:hypothetical protein
MWNTFDTGEITASQFKTYFMYDLNTLPAEASIIKMPMDNGYCMFFVYLQKNKFVDSIINKEGWETKDISSITKHLVKNGFKN